jgi:hypothetical protein
MYLRASTINVLSSTISFKRYENYAIKHLYFKIVWQSSTAGVHLMYEIVSYILQVTKYGPMSLTFQFRVARFFRYMIPKLDKCTK